MKNIIIKLIIAFTLSGCVKTLNFDSNPTIYCLDLNNNSCLGPMTEEECISIDESSYTVWKVVQICP